LVPNFQKHCVNVQRFVAANVLCFQYKTKQLINVCRKNKTNRVDEKEGKKRKLQKNDNLNTAHLSSLPPTLLRLIFTLFNPEMSQAKQQT